jgi:hypothetical protein
MVLINNQGIIMYNKRRTIPCRSQIFQKFKRMNLYAKIPLRKNVQQEQYSSDGQCFFLPLKSHAVLDAYEIGSSLT